MDSVCEEEARMSQKTLYERLGGYDAITAVVNDLLPRLQGDAQLGRFWQHRGDRHDLSELRLRQRRWHSIL